ncbi:MAG: hypothetical protein BGO21_00085 [Dyadobacter sp. 50-39]|uniref:SusC/RagA family TonB-linked outer membrane protein n=1 Tax=Dyadobacter sp. 50-39 TaxID=1895756 RepID=UPI00095A7DE9|nr:SusC/RagA family TonB-linked outer membrane protein [Dyadobacter sp. 50-39]OJV20450.1 MAG: hypothetical protein BGO21_00085 [Dyadobacter sp. 50-39]
MKKVLNLVLCTLLSTACFAQQLTVRGKVLSLEDKSPLAGASIVHKASLQGVSTDSSGHFRIVIPASDPILVVSFIGYNKKEIVATGSSPLLVELEPDPNQLGEVIISSGYQQLPRERATGSFVQVDNQLLNLRVSPDIISRLEDNVPGLVFNRSGAQRSGAQSAISIRGQSTLFGREDPLIVLDNFPYTGDLASINPNDVESMTILKDAAAASIWGAQSSNGVIVITTKKGKFNQPVQVSFNANVTAAQKPDQFYLPRIGSSDYIDIEKMLFGRGYYNTFENDDVKTAFTPVVELLIAERDGKITVEQTNAQIEALRKNDVRKDIERYLYRTSLNQQYAVNIRGGSASSKYFVSAGYDKNLAAQLGNSFNRATVNINNTFSLLKQKLEITTALYYTSSKNTSNAVSAAEMNISNGKPLPPYMRLADDAGNPVAVTHTYRDSFINTASQQGLLDWTYNPRNEINANDNTTRLNDYRMNLNAAYRIGQSITLQALYQYSGSSNLARNRQSKDSWYTRDMINRFTIVNADGTLTRPVPVGDILDINQVSSAGHSLRTQLNYNKDFGKAGNLTALVGAEIRGMNTQGYSTVYYGFDNEMATSSVVDYLSYFKSYVNPSSAYNQIPSYASLTDLTDRYISYYGNAAYTHSGKYTVSASARLDQSNLFGVKTNQKGVPLYSAGFAWKLSSEKFYGLNWLSYLNLRTTYGYNGNIDKSLSAYTTANFFGASSLTGLPYAVVANPPNPQLRWERTRIVNFGLDFKTKNNRISGAVEYYLKKGMDLIGDTPFAPQTGITTFRGNTANTKGNGFELNLTSQNLRRTLGWQTTFILSYAKDKVTRYLAKPTSVAGSYLTTSSVVPTEGKPLYAVYSYPWAGLDPATGDPQGLLNGEVSKDYLAIKSSTTLDQLQYNGTLRPLVFGAIRNTFTYKGLSLSANISYRLGYYIRTPSVNYAEILRGEGGHANYNLRWQNPGDENLTHVPSMPLVNNSARNEFYTYSSVLVQKGDHIRLQDINLSYSLSKSTSGWLPVQAAQFYLYANNIGIIYKRTRSGLDPDYLNSPPAARSLAAGIKVDF